MRCRISWKTCGIPGTCAAARAGSTSPGRTHEAARCVHLQPQKAAVDLLVAPLQRVMPLASLMLLQHLVGNEHH